jgi:hypothetical protein
MALPLICMWWLVEKRTETNKCSLI